MSVTISLTPILLFSSIGIIAEILSNKTPAQFSENNALDYVNKNKLDFEKVIFSREFETNLADRDTLIKTIQEHGCTIEKELPGSINCKIDNLSLEFFKENNDLKEPYKLRVSCSESNKTNYNNIAENTYSFINDIKQEYAINAQEVSYNKIKSRLEEKKMQIESEEVYDDDTIVITVNLD